MDPNNLDIVELNKKAMELVDAVMANPPYNAMPKEQVMVRS